MKQGSFRIFTYPDMIQFMELRIKYMNIISLVPGVQVSAATALFYVSA